jgi:hypothetical protein
MNSTDTLGRHSAGRHSALAGKFESKKISRKKWQLNDNNLPNNAYFIGYLTYQSKQNMFKEAFKDKFKYDFNRYLKSLKQQYPTSIVF